MVAVEQRAVICHALRQEFPELGSAITPALIDNIRLGAIENQDDQGKREVAESLGKPRPPVEALYEDPSTTR